MQLTNGLIGDWEGVSEDGRGILYGVSCSELCLSRRGILQRDEWSGCMASEGELVLLTWSAMDAAVIVIAVARLKKASPMGFEACENKRLSVSWRCRPDALMSAIISCHLVGLIIKIRESGTLESRWRAGEFATAS